MSITSLSLGETPIIQYPPSEVAPGGVVVARRIALLRGGPFRAPHHTVSRLGLLGELALAGRGTIYLDQFDHFSCEALEDLVRVLHVMAPGTRPLILVSSLVPEVVTRIFSRLDIGIRTLDGDQVGVLARVLAGLD